MIVVDASAVLAVAFAEAGADLVLRRLHGARMSTVNWTEVVSRVSDKSTAIDAFLAAAPQMGIVYMPFDFDQAQLAAALRPVTRHAGLSLGDRACLALAKTLDLTVVTADRNWRDLDIGVTIELIR